VHDHEETKGGELLAAESCQSPRRVARPSRQLRLSTTEHANGRCDSLAKMLPAEGWARLSAGRRSKGERLYDWACVSLPDPDAQQAERWLQKPPVGRPRRDHSRVLAGILWVIGSDSSWRELPQEEFGPWRTV
jgi:hypothetical protein